MLLHGKVSEEDKVRLESLKEETRSAELIVIEMENKVEACEDLLNPLDLTKKSY